MADTTISALTALAGESAAAGDFIVLDDIDANATKKMTLAEFMEVYPVVITAALAGSGLHATQDKFPVWDNGVPKYMLSTELQIGLFATAAAITSGLHATEDTLLYDDNGVAKKITVPNLFAGAVVLATAIDTGYHATEDHLIYDDNGTTKKITVPNLLEALGALNTTAMTGSGAHATQDTLFFFDNAVPKSITMQELIAAISALQFAADGLRVATSTPASAGATGVAGTISWDGSFLYVCTATNTWERVAIATW